MKIRHVVVNASPLICLAKSGLANVLPALFEDVMIPPSVEKEVGIKGASDLQMMALLSQQWIRRVEKVSAHPGVIAWDLGDGESEVLSYALEHREYWAALDDLAARRCAASMGCPYIGTVGIIVLSRRQGIIPSVRESLQALQRSGLWLSKDFIQRVCESVGE
jgi:predicted nucleic acid-binding protein